MVPELLNSLALNLEFLRRMVADLDEDQMVGQAGGLVNHPAWTLGHIAHSFEAMGGELGMSPWLPKDWVKRFGTGTAPVQEPTAYPDKAALLDALDGGQQRLNERLSQMSADDPAHRLGLADGPRTAPPSGTFSF